MGFAAMSKWEDPINYSFYMSTDDYAEKCMFLVEQSIVGHPDWYEMLYQVAAERMFFNEASSWVYHYRDKKCDGCGKDCAEHESRSTRAGDETITFCFECVKE